MKIGAIVSEVQRDVVQILKVREDINGRNRTVSNARSLWHLQINNNHHQGAEPVSGSGFPSDLSSRALHNWGITAPTTKDLLRT